MTLQLFDVLLQSPLWTVIVEDLAKYSPLSPSSILHSDGLLSARVQLEQDIVSYLSLIPNCISSCKSDDYIEDMSRYMREAHSKV